MIADEIVRHLEARGARSRRLREGDYMVQCPAHDDRTPSLHVTDRDGKVLLTCQAGCETQAALDAAELDWGDLFHESRNGHREIVATYDYTDPQGRLAFQTVRYWPKDFRQRQPDGAGGWNWSITEPPVTRWLYRTPRVIEALKRGEPIYIAEGEKDVDALERLGLYATTNPMGAGKWRDEHSRMLEGAAHVRVVRDLDSDEKGQKHAAAVVASLRRVGIEPTLREPRAGKDVSDHLRAGHSVEELVLVETEQAPEAEPPDARRVVLTSARAIRSERLQWLMPRRIPLRGQTVVAGEKGLGKSVLTNAWLPAGITRGTIEGALYEQPSDVIIITAEDDWRTVVKPRLEAHGADLDRVHRLTVEDKHGQALFTLPDDVALIEAELDRRGRDVRLIVVDPIAPSSPSARTPTLMRRSGGRSTRSPCWPMPGISPSRSSRT